MLNNVLSNYQLPPQSTKKTGITAENLQSKFSEMISDVINEQFVADNSALLTAGNSFVSARGKADRSSVDFINYIVKQGKQDLS